MSDEPVGSLQTDLGTIPKLTDEQRHRATINTVWANRDEDPVTIHDMLDALGLLDPAGA